MTVLKSRETKYELLSDKKRPSNKLKYAVLIIGILCLTITIIAICYFERQRYKHNESKQKQNFINKKTVYTGTTYMKYREKLYEEAYKQMHEEYISNYTNNQTYGLQTFQDNHEFNWEPMKLVCYYNFPTPGYELKPQNIDPYLCTHINVGILHIVNSSVPISEENKEIIEQVVNLKSSNPKLKVLLCIGDMDEKGQGFSAVVNSSSTRKKFIQELLTILFSYFLDGIDFDWEFPAWKGDESERSNFVLFLKEFRNKINDSKSDFLISVAVGAPATIIDISYDIPEMAKYVDYVNVMGYDYHFFSWYLPLTGANAPLYSRPEETEYFSTLNTNWSIMHWLHKGMPRQKILLGLPTYGHSFWLVNPDNHGWSAPTSGFGSIGEEGFVKYPDVCNFLNLRGSSYEFDRDSEVPYAYRNHDWISYDDVRSVAYKAEYAMSHSLGGVMVFSLNHDDYNGVCAGTSFLLIRQIKNILIDKEL